MSLPTAYFADIDFSKPRHAYPYHIEKTWKISTFRNFISLFYPIHTYFASPCGLAQLSLDLTAVSFLLDLLLISALRRNPRMKIWKLEHLIQFARLTFNLLPGDLKMTFWTLLLRFCYLDGMLWLI